MLKIDIWNIAFTVINLLILYILLRKFLFKPIFGIMEKREQLIRESLENADKSKSESEKLFAQAKEALDTSAEKGEALADERLEAAQSEYDKIIESAKEEAKNIIENGRERAALERKKMLDDARNDIVNLAMETAEKLTGTQQNKEQANALFDELLEKTQLEKVGRN